MDVKKIIKKQIEDNIKRYYPDININKIQISIKPYHKVLITTPYSDAQFLVEIKIRQKDGGELVKYMFAKKFKNARNEFENWQKIKELSRGPNKLIPKYFDLIKKENILLTDYVHPAQNSLYKFLKMHIAIKNKDESIKLIEKIAEWLVEFQNKCTLGKSADLSLYIQNAEKELKNLPNFSTKEKEHLIEKISMESANISNIPKVFSGDLYLRHILIKNDKLIVVDWDNLKTSHSCYDIHTLFINLESRTRHPFVFTKKYINGLEKEFLEHYKKLSKFEFSEETYHITRIMYLIHFLYSYNWRYKDKIIHTKKMLFWRYFMYNLKTEVKNYLRN